MPNPKPILIYDGDCGFCRRWIERWRWITGDRIEYAPYQEVAARFPEISEEEFKSAVQLVEPDGKIYRAAEAVFRALSVVRSTQWPLWAYLHVPGVRWAAEFSYRFVANHRAFFSKTSGLYCEDGERKNK